MPRELTSRQVRELPGRVRRHVLAERLLDRGARVLVAISGGADSAALLGVLQVLAGELDLCLIAANADHGLRDATPDAAAVAGLTARLGVPLRTGRLDVARRPGQSLEEAAREARHAFLEATADETGATRIATGHTLDDRAETLLLNLFRGAGPRGLSRPVAQRGRVIRPLLGERRATVRAWARAQDLPSVEDPSNQDRRFRRNRLRLDLLPALEETFGAALPERLATTAGILDEEDRLLDTLAAEALAALRQLGSAPGIRLSAELLRMQPTALQPRIVRAALAEVKGDLRRISARHVADALRLAGKSPRGRQIQLPDGIRVERRYEDVAILRESKQLSPASRNGLEVPLAGEGHYLLPGIGSATLTPGRAPEVPASPECAHLDPGRIADLVLRTRRPGDRIRLLGGPGTRKLSDLFIDCKVPRDQRDRWPLLAVAGQARVLWVPGLRVGEGPWAAPGAESLRLGISWPRP